MDCLGLGGRYGANPDWMMFLVDITIKRGHRLAKLKPHSWGNNSMALEEQTAQASRHLPLRYRYPVDDATWLGHRALQIGLPSLAMIFAPAVGGFSLLGAAVAGKRTPKDKLRKSWKRAAAGIVIGAAMGVPIQVAFDMVLPPKASFLKSFHIKPH